MTIAFTICSINYLAQARTLGDSLKKTNPEILFFIGLVDKLEGISFEESHLPEYPMIEIDKIEISDFAEMANRYNITELNTAVKPFYFTYFFRNYAKATRVIYFDPDIIVYQPITELLNNIDQYGAVLTPHINTEITDRLTPNELHHLNTGIYNLGFAAFGRNAQNLQYLQWWEEKLRYECYIDLCNGLFTDQHWMDFLPVFVDNVHIERNPGYNAAYWNLHERTFKKLEGTFYVNDDFPLIFFHYSGYDPNKADVLSKYQDRIALSHRPDLTELFQIYRNSLLDLGNGYYRDFPCFYIKPTTIKRYLRVRKWIKKPFEFFINQLQTT